MDRERQSSRDRGCVEIQIIYYAEINLTCIIILLLFRGQLHLKSEQFSSARIIFERLLWATVVLCASDMLAGLCRGQLFHGARGLIELSNLVYFEALTVISYLWMLYVYVKLQLLADLSRRRMLLWALPLLAFTAIALSNPFTHILFFVDENNLYVRNYGVYLHWVVSWLYLLIPTVQTARMALRAKNRQKRQEILPFLYFIVAPIVASVLQMLFYGVSSSQVGVTISIVAIFISVQTNQVLTDALTGLSNRRGLNNYLSDYVLGHPSGELVLLMMDIDNFKQVNDVFGHMIGDRALRDTGEALKQACREMSGSWFACRYGGDEFVIAASDPAPEEVAQLQALIHEKLEARNLTGENPYILAVSLGLARGVCRDLDAAECLLRAADDAMYAAKQRNKRASVPQAAR